MLAMRFDCNEIANLMSEVAAYGTAVTVVAQRQPVGRGGRDDDGSLDCWRGRPCCALVIPYPGVTVLLTVCQADRRGASATATPVRRFRRGSSATGRAHANMVENSGARSRASSSSRTSAGKANATTAFAPPSCFLAAASFTRWSTRPDSGLADPAVPAVGLLADFLILMQS